MPDEQMEWTDAVRETGIYGSGARVVIGEPYVRSVIRAAIDEFCEEGWGQESPELTSEVRADLARFIEQAIRHELRTHGGRRGARAASRG